MEKKRKKEEEKEEMKWEQGAVWEDILIEIWDVDQDKWV